VSFEEEFEEEWLVDMMNANCHLCPDQVAIHSLKDREATDVERLMKV
jgi:hypothetical protein